MTKLNKDANSFFPTDFKTVKEVPPQKSPIYQLVLQVLDRFFPKPAGFSSDYTFGQYLCKVAELNRFSDESLVLSLTYLHRIYDFRSSKNDFQSTTTMDHWWQLHRYALSGLRLASKFLEDVCVNNQTFAFSVGCPVQMINAWERQFFQFMNFDIHVEITDYFAFLQFLQSLLSFSSTTMIPSKTLNDFILKQKIDVASNAVSSSSVSETREINNSVASLWFSKLTPADRLSISHHWLLFDCTRNASGPAAIHLLKEEILKEILKEAKDESSLTLVFVESSV